MELLITNDVKSTQTSLFTHTHIQREDRWGRVLAHITGKSMEYFGTVGSHLIHHVKRIESRQAEF